MQTATRSSSATSRKRCLSPLEQLVVGVDLCGEPVVGILVADYYTVVVDIVEGGKEVTLVVAA